MDAPAAALAYPTFTDDRLLDLLLTEEDRLPRAAVDEFVARGERMVEPLTRILQSEEAWGDEDAGFWEPIHAAFILGAIGGEKAIPGLLAALRFSNEADVDWVTEAISSMFAAIGPPAIQPLLDRCRETDPDSWERLMAFSALRAIAERHPERRTEVLDFLRGVADDADEPDNARFGAGYELLDFARPGDRESLLRLARRAEGSEPFVLFNRRDVHDAYGPNPPRPHGTVRDWLQFYAPDEIEKRQQRWRKEDEARRRAEPADDLDTLDDESLADLIGADIERPLPEPGRTLKADPARVGRNAPCPCGSGKKFKKCCEE